MVNRWSVGPLVRWTGLPITECWGMIASPGERRPPWSWCRLTTWPTIPGVQMRAYRRRGMSLVGLAFSNDQRSPNVARCDANIWIYTKKMGIQNICFEYTTQCVHLNIPPNDHPYFEFIQNINIWLVSGIALPTFMGNRTASVSTEKLSSFASHVKCEVTNKICEKSSPSLRLIPKNVR